MTLAALLTLIPVAAIAPAYATDADDRVDAARADEQSVGSSVAEIEARLADLATQLADAQAQGKIAEAAYNDAMSNLVVAKQDAEAADQALEDAKGNVSAAQDDLTSLVRTVYTKGPGSLSSLSPYLTDSGLDDVALRSYAVRTLGDRAESQLKAYEQAENAASDAASAAQDALATQEQRTAEVKAAKEQADAVTARVQGELESLNSQHDALVAKLAEARGVTLEAEQERQAQLDAERAEREKAAQEAAIAEVQRQAEAAEAAAREKAEQETADKKAAEEAAAKEAAEADAAKQAADEEAAQKAAEAEAAKQAEDEKAAEEAEAARAEADRKAAEAKKAAEEAAAKKAAEEEAARKAAEEAEAAASSSDEKGQIVANYALKFVGTPYVWGGTTPSGFDCSGLVQYAYKNALGVNLPRVTWDQAKAGHFISRSEARVGDLVYYGGHIGIYLGNGQMVHAPKPGDHVKVAPVYGNPQYVRVL